MVLYFLFIVFVALLFASSVSLAFFVSLFRVLQFANKVVRRAVKRRALGPALQVAARQLGDGRAASSLFRASLVGERAGFRISVSDRRPPNAIRPPHDWVEGLTFELTSPTPLPPRMGLYDRSIELYASEIASAVRMFDDSFDRIFQIRGRPADVVARLDATTRARLLALAGEGTLLANGPTLRFTTPLTPDHTEPIMNFIDRLTELAQGLFATEPSTEVRLLAMAASESSPAVRYQLLDLLLRNFAGSPEASEALRLARSAPERGIRYLAAVRDGDAGLPLIEEIVGCADEPITLREMALRHLARHAPRDQALPILRRALAFHALPLVRVAVELLGRLQDRASIELLIGVVAGLEDARFAELRADVCDALGFIGDASAESYLLDLAEHDPALPVRLAAIEALGRAGATTAIGPLTRLTSRAGSPRRLGSAARAAVARIEARLGPRESGRLSLAPVDEARGALSLDTSEGQLSLLDGNRPRVEAEAPAEASSPEP